MAVHGLSLAERERYILKADPAHPDNLKRAINLATAKAESQEERDAAIARVEAQAGTPTVFLLGNLQHEDRVYLTDLSGGMEQTAQGGFRMTPKNGLKASEAVRRALKGWENFTSPSGDNIKFETAPAAGERGQPRSFVSQESMSAMHVDIINELSARILEINGVTGAVEKKLLTALQAGFEPASQDGPATDVPTETKNNEDAGSQA